MAILTTDIKLIQAADQSETDSGGGYMGAVEVVDGVENNLFPDISRLDRVYSRLHFKKAFLHVQSANNDAYLGAHAAITGESTDTGVYEFLLPATTDDDTREEIIAQVEDYYVQGFHCGPFVNSSALGASYIVVEADLSGFTGQLHVVEGDESEMVTVVSSTVAIWVYDGASHRVSTLTLSEPLQRAYTTDAAVYHVTRNANWRAYGITHPSDSISPGATSFTLAEWEQGFISSNDADRTITNEKPWLADPETYALPKEWEVESYGVWMESTDTTKSAWLRAGGVAPGTFRCRIYWDSNNEVWLKDDFQGGVMHDAEAGVYKLAGGKTLTGTMDYVTGLLTITLSAAIGKSGNIYYFRAKKTPQTDAIMATDSRTATDTSIYSGTLNPPSVAPLSVVIHYRAGLNWYTVTDDGDGNLIGDGSGSIDYTSGNYVVEFDRRTTDGSTILLRWHSGYWLAVGLAQSEPLGTGDGVETDFLLGSIPRVGSVAINYTVGATVKELWDGGDGKLYETRDILTGATTAHATINYETGAIHFYTPPDDTTAITAVEYTYGTPPATTAYNFRTAYTGLNAGTLSFYIYDADGALRTITDDGLGVLSGTDVTGTVDYVSGTVAIACNFAVQEGTLSLNYAAGTQITPSSDRIGLNVNALPSSGKVPVFYENELILIQEGASEELALITALDEETGVISLGAPLANSYTTAAIVSSVLTLGDLQSAKSLHFTQDTWDGVTWSDTQSGSSSTGSYDFVNHPMTIRNDGAVTDRWAIKFTSATDFSLYSERLGLVTTGDTSTELAPTNPNTSAPFFTLATAGWGGTWAYGHVLRFNTVDAAAPFWVVRSIHAGSNGVASDAITIALRGDEDA